MFRRLAVISLLVGGGLAIAPTGASAAPLCEEVAYTGVTTVTVGPECIPFSAATECTSGHVLLGNLGTVYDEVCLPAVL